MLIIFRKLSWWNFGCEKRNALSTMFIIVPLFREKVEIKNSSIFPKSWFMMSIKFNKMLFFIIRITSRKFNFFAPISKINCNLEWKLLKMFKILSIEGTVIAMSSTSKIKGQTEAQNLKGSLFQITHYQIRDNFFETVIICLMHFNGTKSTFYW